MKKEKDWRGEYRMNPFDLHPEHEPVEKKSNNILTLQQVRDTINKQCKIY